MTTKVTKLAMRAYFVLLSAAAPLAVVHAQTGAAGGGQGGAGTGTAGAVAGQPGGTAGGTGAAGAGNGAAPAGQSDQGYAQAQDNGSRGGGGSKTGWLGLLGLLGLLGMRKRDTGATHVRDTAPSYETTGARR
jgi:MYXO-CTERM domain-containing protein